MGVCDEVPGTWEGTLVWVTGWGVGVTGWESGESGQVWEGPSGLPAVGSFGAGGDDVSCPPTVCAETSVRPATAFVEGERAAGSPRAINLHGIIAGGGRGLTGGGNGWQARRGVAAGVWRMLLLVMGSGKGGSEQIVLDRNGCSDISLESGGYRSVSGKLEPDRLLHLPREKVDEGMIRPVGFEVHGDVLEGNR